MKVSFYTFGCRLNQAETAILQQSFERAGFEVVDFRDPADVVVVNTCTVTENGDADARKLVNRIVRRNRRARIALIGCQAQVQRDRLLEMPGVKWVVGNAKKMDLPDIIRHSSGEKPEVIVPAIPKGSFTIDVPGIDRQHTRANLKIQDGCDFFCSFCEIPFARGRARSRDFQDLVREAQELAKAGHQEIVLTGINLGTYRDGTRTIVDVIEALENVPGLRRIRISSIEPTTIPDAILDKMARGGKLCRHLHVPLQSGTDEILRRMNRNYTVEEFTAFVRKAAERVPDVCLGTDIIVGFPGETEAHFWQTTELVKELPFAYFHVFSYSEREHSKSRGLEGKVPPEVIERRSKILRELSARKRRTYYERFVGRTVTVLFEQKKNGYWTGLTDTYVRVKVQSDLDLANRFCEVYLEKVEEQAVVGVLR